jgi:hypothetical protein
MKRRTFVAGSGVLLTMPRIVRAQTTKPTRRFPDASTTGLPAETVLTPTGGFSANTAGATYNALDINGSVDIYAANVTFQNCRFRAGGGAFWLANTRGSNGNSPGTVFRRCTFIGPGAASTAGTMGFQSNDDGTGTVTIDGCDISGVEHAVHFAAGTLVVTNNYIHDLLSVTNSHYDGMFCQSHPVGTGTVLIQNNYCNLAAYQNSSVILQNSGTPDGTITNITINANLFIGGGWCISVDNSRSSFPINSVITNNALVTGQYGYSYFRGTTTGTTWSGNYDYNTGATITIGE